MPVGPGREQNVIAALTSLENQTVKPEGIVLVHDGEDAFTGQVSGNSIPTVQVVMPRKHEPGMEQPRNYGVRVVEDHFDADHVWFVDSDIIFRPFALDEYHKAHGIRCLFQHQNRILIGPYDWLPPNVRHEIDDPEEVKLLGGMKDPRWVSFNKFDPDEVRMEDIGDGLACFSGNLIWPIDRFKEVGGFWNEIHHGRCEDGELGLRATALGVPISFVREARGWHLWHPVNTVLAEARNTRDVPMLNARHPWVEGEGLAVVPKDGRRFDALCPTCQQYINTIEMWEHEATCKTVTGVAS